MNAAQFEIETPDGSVMPCHSFHPSGDGPWPAVVYYMDGMGIRPTLLQSAEKLAGLGYYVLVPDLYHRSGDYVPLDHSTLQDDPVQQARVMEMIKLVTNGAVMRDLSLLIDHLDRQPETSGGGAGSQTRVGVVGYCLGGRLALSAAAAFPDRVGVAASIHGASLATDKADSPHLLADKMKADLYLAVAEVDPYIIPGETERIDQALREAGARYELELYAGCHHGFALVGAHGFDAAADERHHQKLHSLFQAGLFVA